MQSSFNSRSSRIVAAWVMTGVTMLIVQVILGAITRLTGSGLSITEWNIATGTLPPLNQQQWITEFHKYQHTPQYQLLNSDFTLANYKFIFFWEWVHRFWARMVAVVFIVGFAGLLLARKLQRQMIAPLVILFLLGALQGAIGWIMVKSGLSGDAIYVRPTRLAMHFVFALGLIAYAFWFGLQLTTDRNKIVFHRSLNQVTVVVIVLAFLQLLFGALMAGHKAASAAPTWPDINGDWLPGSMFSKSPFLLNFIDNKITIHFMHRLIAYLLFALTIVWMIIAFRYKGHGYINQFRMLPVILITIQLCFGIATVFASRRIVAAHWGGFEWLAIFHQFIGMSYLLTMILMLYIVRRGKQNSRKVLNFS